MGGSVRKPLKVLDILATPMTNPVRHIKESGRILKSVAGFFRPEPPELTEQEVVEQEELIDEEALRLLAQQRRSIESRRVGRSRLRIDRPIRSPGVALGTSSGLRIP